MLCDCFLSPCIWPKGFQGSIPAGHLSCHPNLLTCWTSGCASLVPLRAADWGVGFLLKLLTPLLRHPRGRRHTSNPCGPGATSPVAPAGPPGFLRQAPQLRGPTVHGPRLLAPEASGPGTPGRRSPRRRPRPAFSEALPPVGSQGFAKHLPRKRGGAGGSGSRQRGTAGASPSPSHRPGCKALPAQGPCGPTCGPTQAPGAPRPPGARSLGQHLGLHLASTWACTWASTWASTWPAPGPAPGPRLRPACP